VKNLFFILILLSFSNPNTCLQTYQFKVFPVGMLNEQIISVDIKIYRTQDISTQKDPSLEIGWYIETYLSTYDEYQKLTQKKLLNKQSIHKKSYAHEIQLEYEKAFKVVKKMYPKIEYFQPKAISFCEFQNKCKMMESYYDEKEDKDYIRYKGKNHLISVIKDAAYYGFKESAFFSDRISGYAISSTRVYLLGNVELVVGHLESGHELSYITHDPNKKPKDESDIVIYMKEHTPDIDFSDIKKATYEEPLLHHG